MSTGIGRTICNQVPENGMLVQTPDGVATVNLLINEVLVEMGSTVYFRVDEQQRLVLAALEGAARVSSYGESRTVVEGSSIAVPLNENLQASAEPGNPESYLGDESIQRLPLTPLEREIEPDLGLEQSELDLLLAYAPVLDYLQLQESDEFLDYLLQTENPDVPTYLLEAGYSDFGDELEIYFEETLGYDLDNYPEYLGDDEPIYYGDGFEDSDMDGLDDTFDDFIDADGDEIEDRVDDFVDSDGDGADDRSSANDADQDGIDDTFDDFVDANGDGLDDRSSGTDSDGDGIDDSFDTYIDSDGDGTDDRAAESGLGQDTDSDGIDDNSDEWVDTNSDGFDDRSSGTGDENATNPPESAGEEAESSAGRDADGDGIEDSEDDWVDTDGDGLDDRS